MKIVASILIPLFSVGFSLLIMKDMKNFRVKKLKNFLKWLWGIACIFPIIGELVFYGAISLLGIIQFLIWAFGFVSLFFIRSEG